MPKKHDLITSQHLQDDPGYLGGSDGHCTGKGIFGTGAIGGNCPLETGRGKSCTSSICMRSSLHDHHINMSHAC